MKGKILNSFLSLMIAFKVWISWKMSKEMKIYRIYIVTWKMNWIS